MRENPTRTLYAPVPLPVRRRLGTTDLVTLLVLPLRCLIVIHGLPAMSLESDFTAKLEPLSAEEHVGER
jgi:hypothetical protein